MEITMRQSGLGADRVARPAAKAGFLAVRVQQSAAIQVRLCAEALGLNVGSLLRQGLITVLNRSIAKGELPAELLPDLQAAIALLIEAQSPRSAVLED